MKVVQSREKNGEIALFVKSDRPWEFKAKFKTFEKKLQLLKQLFSAYTTKFADEKTSQ